MKGSILLIIIQLFALALVAQTKPYKDITISGHFSEKAIGEFFRDTEFWYYKEVPPTHFTITSNHKFSIKDGNFSIKIEPETSYGFFRCRATQIPSLQLDYFLVQQGDSIFMEVTDKRNVFFTGRGSEKLNYIHFAAKTIENFNYLQPGDSLIYKVGKDELLLEKYRACLKICQDSLEKLKGETDPTTLEILRINTVSKILNNYQSSLSANYAFKDLSKKSQIINDLQLMLLQQQSSVLTDSILINYCNNYKELLYTTQVNLRKLQNTGNNISAANLESIYPHFQNEYNGKIRDWLISSLILNNDLDPDVMNLSEKSLHFIQDKTSYDEISKFIKSRSKGVPAYNFTFETLDGKEVKLNDFKGQLLIIDTWYKGCIACSKLAKILSPLVDKYSKENKVVFLSVNVDFKKEKFREGVQSGLYGNKKVVHTWTRGNGSNDPFIKHYQYIGYPNILIIDKNGNVVTANAFKNESEILKNIENYIKTYQ